MSYFSFYMAHGAGLGHGGGFLNRFAVTFCRTHKINYIPLTFDYMKQIEATDKRRPPPKFAQLVEEFASFLNPDAKDGSIIVAGKSMGGRVATQLSSDPRVAAIVCLGFPFHQQGKPDKHRLSFLEHMQKPCLIIQGTRDAFGKPAWVEQHTLHKNIKVHWFDGADHDFSVLKSTGKDQDQIMSDINLIISKWLAAQLSV
ncbi:hypothetical protein MED121_01655 [Marinomonas sp. MED121]|uniref:alpha/beta family hydrolase n=1 Tax=Marinomonas sp. MED121 TaxID=314277 RepID=UPI0000690B51|nr:alpha/beta family hydrolase [Marinomonas sp. MED121]EAQ65876.1 hypothetical protein MED121_01655 [Marinomonas sp. MED121]